MHPNETPLLFASDLLVSRADVRGSFWLTPSLEFDMLQKLYYVRKGEQLFSYTFCLLNDDLMQKLQL